MKPVKKTSPQVSEEKYRWDNSVAKLVMVVEYTEFPSDNDLQELLEKARELGGIRTAEFTLRYPGVRDVSTL